jgi:inhibitor of KinA sporulation pathway (predicted exonuclease)
MNYIVLDLEWNQPYNVKQMKIHPFPLTGEIIQIGAVKLNERFEMTDTFKLSVCPKFYTKLHEHVKKVTELSQKSLMEGCCFQTAAEQFREWCRDPFVFLTWGYDDIPMLLDNMNVHRLDTGWIPPYYNIQVIFHSQENVEKRQYSLQAVLDYFEVEKTVNAHDAFNDAFYTAQICAKLDMPKGIVEYADTRSITGNHIIANEGFYFADKKSAFASKKITQILCPECGLLMRYECWVRQNGERYIALASCPEHGDFLARIKFTRYGESRVHVKKVLCPATETLRAQYDKKYQEKQNNEYKYSRSRRFSNEA